MRIRPAGSDSKVEMQMTPMIDMVFQLLIYFLFTFRISTAEGDLNIKLPKQPDAPVEENLVMPLVVALHADEVGNLRELAITTRGLTRAIPVVPGSAPSARDAFASLLEEVKQYVGRETGPNSLRTKVEARISFDYHLHYRYVIDAMTNVSGYREGREIVRLIEKVHFEKAKPPEAKQP
jgi:biopolymer transport protein ExbD